MIDTHAHINTKEFDNRLDEVLMNAKLNGVDKILVVGMDTYHNLRAIELASTFDNLYASVGIHPTSLGGQVKELLPLFKHKKVVAVGETGIDLYWDKSNLDEQIKYFTEQIELAISLNLPIIVHTRNSFNEAYECLLPYKGKIKGVFHSFSSDIEDAKKAIELGFLIGISGVVTFKKATELHEIVEKIDISHMILETDSPYLAPVPFRGKMNEPGYTKYVLETVSKIKNMKIHEVDKITTLNAMKLFQLEETLWKKYWISYYS